MKNSNKVLLVDLNNFARYPSMSIGYLASVLRQAGIFVSVYAPLMVGVRGVTREARPHRFSLLAARLNHRAATSASSWVRGWRNRLAARRLSDVTAHEGLVVEQFQAALMRDKPDAVMILFSSVARLQSGANVDLARV